MDDLNQPAFPSKRMPSIHNPDQSPIEYQGMTLRDYFAAKAMQGIIAKYGNTLQSPETTAKEAYEMANAMLEERNKKHG